MNTAELSLPTLPSLNFSWPRKLLELFAPADLAMDLGTANTLIYARHRGIILNEPSVVAVEEGSNKPLAVGRAAKEMFGKTAVRIRCVRPMKDGVIADFDVTSIMIRDMITRVCNRWSIQKPRIVIGVPSGITQVEKRAVIDAANQLRRPLRHASGRTYGSRTWCQPSRRQTSRQYDC